MTRDDTVAPGRGILERWSVGRWLALGVLLWLIASLLTLRSANQAAQRAASETDALRSLTSEEGVTPELVHARLTTVHQDFETAADDLSSPILWPMRALPVVGRQIRSANHLADVGETLTARATRISDILTTADQDDRLALLEDIEVELLALRAEVDLLDLGPVDGLVAPLADARNEAAEAVVTLETELDGTIVVVHGVRRFLSGDNYLVLGTNNAEMRVASGMTLTASELEIDDGALSLPGLANTSDMVVTGDYGTSLGLPVVVGVVDQDVEDRWGSFGLTDDFRKLNYSARFGDFVAPQAQAMWLANTGSPTAGVIAVDPYVIAALVDLLGTVDYEGRSYDSQETLDFLLTGQYLEFGENESDEQEARREVLSAFAVTISAALQDGEVDALGLLRALRPLIEGRHLMLYSNDPAQQAAWEQLGASGSVDADQLGVSVINNGASKLDPYLDVDVAATTSEGSDGTEVELVVTVANSGSSALPPFVLGPWEQVGLDDPGAYRGRLVYTLPRGALPASVSHSVEPDVLGVEGDSIVVSAPVTVPSDGTSTFTLRFTIEQPPEALRLLPSTRFPATNWSWNARQFIDDDTHELPL